MRHLKTGAARGFFRVLTDAADSRSVQAAKMTLAPGQSSGEFGDEHPKSEQWLLVLSGTGRARVGKSRVSLRPNSLLLIEKGEPHQITNTGRRPLVTLNFYSPPAYTPDGELRPPQS